MKKILSALLVCSIAIASLMPLSLASAVDVLPGRYVDNQVLTFFYFPEKNPIEDEICALINATGYRVTEMKKYDQNGVGTVYGRLALYTLSESGSEKVTEAVNKIIEKYSGNELFVEAIPNYLGDLDTPDGIIDDPAPFTVTDVINLRNAIISNNYDDIFLNKYDYDKNGILSVIDVVMLRQQIIFG